MSLQIRNDIFDHSVFPTPTKLTLSSLCGLFQNLIFLSNIENKITLDQFKENFPKFIPNTTEKDGEIYFLNYKIMAEDDQSFLINLQKKPLQNQQQITADVRGLAVYFFLQLYSLSARHNFNFDLTKSQFNEGFRGNLSGNLSHNFSPLNSPRSKATRTPQFTNEQQQIIYYIKYNLKTILKLIANDLNKEDITLSASEFNILELILQLQNQNNQKNQLSLNSQLFKTNNKVNVNILAEFLNNNLNQNEATESYVIQGLTKSVMSKEQIQCQNLDVKIQNCEDSYIYIDSSVKTLCIRECVNTTIFVSAVAKVCTVEKCENIILTVASNFLRVGNTVDSTIHYYGSYSPVLYGDNRQITLAPNNTNYTEFLQRIKTAGIPLSVMNSQCFLQPVILNSNINMNFSILAAKDFFALILPSQFKPVHHLILQNFDMILQPNFEKILNEQKNQESSNIIIPILSPDNYREIISSRYKMHNDLQSLIKTSGLADDKQRLLHSAIQGHFREWLVTTGQIKPIQDLVKLIDQE